MLDSHCHLNSFPENELNAIIAETKKQKMNAIISSGFDFDSSIQNIGIARSNAGFVFATVGVAPQRAQELNSINVAKFANLLNERGVVGVGEIGLDFKWGASEEQRRRQEKTFREFLALAKEKNLPAVVHSRQAEASVLSVLREERAEQVLMHCFSGNKEQARECVDKGYLISVPPMKSGSRNKMLQSVPPEFLVVESDAPFIGEKPIDIIKSAQIIADALKLELGEVKRLTALNAVRFFSSNGV